MFVKLYILITSSMYVTVSKPLWGWSGKPAGGETIQREKQQTFEQNYDVF
jgi:hypothetical protein